MTTTDSTKTITTRSLVLRDIKRTIVADAAFARVQRAEGQRCLAEARVHRKAGDEGRARALVAACFTARDKANDKTDARRHTLLAYAYLRGRCGYDLTEPRCAEGNTPSARWIAEILAERFKAVGDLGLTPSEREVRTWMEVGMAPASSAPEAPREAA